MIRKTKTAKNLKGLFMLPTSSKYHLQEPKRSGAFYENQDAFLLQATEAEGYPQAVVVTAERGALDWQIGDEPDTQHAQVRKNLPPRRVVGILRADGTVEGDLPPKGIGLPHWSYIPANEDGSASNDYIKFAEDLLEHNRSQAKAAKEAAKSAKKSDDTKAA